VTPRRVALTGRGVVSPLGVGVAAHWDALCAGRSGVARLPRLAALGLPATRGGTVAPDLVEPHLGRLPKKRQKLYNRATLFAMLGAALAMEDAGLPHGASDPTRFGVVLGVGPLAWDLGAMTAYLVASESHRAPGTLDTAAANGFCMHHINPLDFSLKTLPNLAAGHVAIAHDAQGFCRAIAEGPIGGARAVGDAYRLIGDGDLDVALCGGADAQLEELVFATYCGAGLVASDDGSHAGLTAGEGSGLLVLEEIERARTRGARLHGEIVGFASCAGDGRLASADEPTRLGSRLARVIERVIEEAGDAPGVVSVHGDGIPAHDAAEAWALARVLGARAETTPRLRMKRAHADLGAAASPVELLACSAALGHATLPPRVSDNSRASVSPVQSALVISLGLFGECAALMVGDPGSDGAR
jgi:3-oxoacyl-[acyl-carrier-protein] synthase II